MQVSVIWHSHACVHAIEQTISYDILIPVSMSYDTLLQVSILYDTLIHLALIYGALIYNIDIIWHIWDTYMSYREWSSARYLEIFSSICVSGCHEKVNIWKQNG